MAVRFTAASRRRLRQLAVLLTALVVLLGVIVIRQQRSERERAEAPQSESSLIEFDRLSARLEKSSDTERLVVGIRLRANVVSPIDCFVFVVARSGRGGPQVAVVWPTEQAGRAISAGGHFHAADPASGYPVALGTSWEKITAVLPHKVGEAPFDSVVVYVVSAQGDTLLARPYPL
jgi:hypothetical protein